MNKISVCAIIKDEKKYIIEWLAYHLIKGISNFYIYDNQSTDGTFELIQKLSKFIPLKVKNWPSIEGISPQLSAYKDCIVNNEWTKEDFLAFIDIDEFIYHQNDLVKFINKFDSAVGAVCLNQKIFGSGGALNYSPEPVIERFQKSSESLYIENEWFKTICRPIYVDNFYNSHSVKLNKGLCINANLEVIPEEEIKKGFTKKITRETRIFHYILKSKEEYKDKKNRGGVAASTLAARKLRHDENYFIGRDSAASQFDCNSMCAVLDKVKDKMSELNKLVS